jgi:hypothetical protein
LRPVAAEKRFILVEKDWFSKVGEILAKKYNGEYKVVTNNLSKPVMRFVSLF